MSTIKFLVIIPDYRSDELEELLEQWRDDQFMEGSLNFRRASTDHQDVRDFHEKFGVPQGDEPCMLGLATYMFRKNFLQEELDEFMEAYSEGDLHKAADALVDLVYVAHGTAAMMGLPWASLWNEVQRANMSKVRATSAEQSKRGSALDVIKPEGWTGPDFTPWLGVSNPQPPAVPVPYFASSVEVLDTQKVSGHD